MPDYSHLARPQTQTPFSTLGDLLNVARTANTLQREQGTLLADIERSKAESARAVTEADVSRRTADPRVAQQAAQTSSAQTAAKHSQWQLTTEQARKAYEIAAGVYKDPAVVKGESAGSMAALMRAEEMMRVNEVPESTIRVQMAPLYQAAAHRPSELRQMLENIVQSGSGVAAQAAVLNTPVQLLNTGGGFVPVQTQPGAQGGIQPGAGTAGTQIAPVQVPPGQRQEVGFHPVTRSPIVTEKDAAGNVIGVRPAPTQGAVPQLAPGQPEDIPILTNLRAQVNAAAAKTPESRFNNSQILKLVNETDTGRQAELVRTMKGPVAGIPWETAGATRYDQLGHFIALEAANSAAAMGAGTDAARTLAEQKTASTGWTPEAIKSAVKVNDALSVGLQKFNEGMEKAIAGNQGNILAVRGFQNAWTQAFDPNVYRYANALATKDEAEIAKILGPAGSEQRKQRALELAQKSAVLHRLTTEGR